MLLQESIQLQEEMGIDNIQVCPSCNSILTRKGGQYFGIQQYECIDCNRKWGTKEDKIIYHSTYAYKLSIKAKDKKEFNNKNRKYINKWLIKKYGTWKKYRTYLKNKGEK